MMAGPYALSQTHTLISQVEAQLMSITHAALSPSSPLKVGR